MVALQAEEALVSQESFFCVEAFPSEQRQLCPQLLEMWLAQQEKLE